MIRVIRVILSPRSFRSQSMRIFFVLALDPHSENFSSATFSIFGWAVLSLFIGRSDKRTEREKHAYCAIGTCRAKVDIYIGNRFKSTNPQKTNSAATQQAAQEETTSQAENDTADVAVDMDGVKTCASAARGYGTSIARVIFGYRSVKTSMHFCLAKGAQISMAISLEQLESLALTTELNPLRISLCGRFTRPWTASRTRTSGTDTCK